MKKRLMVIWNLGHRAFYFQFYKICIGTYVTLFYRHIIKKNPLRGFFNNVFSRRFSYFFFQILKPLESHQRFKRSPFSSTNSCVINCTDQPIKPICGDDSVTYPNHCELEKATKCLGKSVRFQHEGECTSGML